MQDPFQACSEPLTTVSLSIAPSPVSCTLCAGATTNGDALGLLGEISRSRSRAVPFLAAQGMIG